MAVADVSSSLIWIRQIIPLDAIVVSWVDLMKDSNRMPGGFALAADLERAMALDHVGLAKRVCTYAIHVKALGSDLVRHGHGLCTKMTTDVNELIIQAIGFDGSIQNSTC